MSDAPVQTQAGLDAQPPMPVRRLHNFIYCPRLFYFQWVENIFQENADTVAGSMVHRNVDAPSRLDEEKAKALGENLPYEVRTRVTII
jgi:CRISPR-associated protein Cas1